MNSEIEDLLADVRQSKPFPGELHTYQPFYDVPMDGWELVRGDSPQRLAIMMDAVNRCSAVTARLEDTAASPPSFIDLGCCSGFFSDGMSEHGFDASGVDVDRNFIDWATRLANIKDQSISYERIDLLEYLTTTDTTFDVVSTFATVQWVMDQQGYEAGLTCFKEIFRRSKSICVVEMGYTAEDIYKEKIPDRPVEINKDWVMKIMSDIGEFAVIEFHPAGESGIWRDVFVGFRENPAPASINTSLKQKWFYGTILHRVLRRLGLSN